MEIVRESLYITKQWRVLNKDNAIKCLAKSMALKVKLSSTSLLTPKRATSLIYFGRPYFEKVDQQTDLDRFWYNEDQSVQKFGSRLLFICCVPGNLTWVNNKKALFKFPQTMQLSPLCTNVYGYCHCDHVSRGVHWIILTCLSVCWPKAFAIVWSSTVLFRTDMALNERKDCPS